MTGLRCVYAVCRPFGTPLRAELTGVAGAPAALLHHHGLVAVVSTVPEADFCEEALKAHLEDLDWLAATARATRGWSTRSPPSPTPLPLRLGTVFRDDSALRTMIEAREGRLPAPAGPAARPGGVGREGCTWSLNPPSPSPPPRLGPASGRDYLRSRQRPQPRAGGEVAAGRAVRPLPARASRRARRGFPAAPPAEFRTLRHTRTECTQCGLSGAPGALRGIRGTRGPDQGRGARNAGGTHRTVGRVFVFRGGIRRRREPGEWNRDHGIRGRGIRDG